jgi:hypothetical protein
MAVAASTPQLKATFLELSKNWEKLAIQLESASARIVETEDIWSKVQESIDRARRLQKQ